jgi:hypothetical protein
VIPVKPKLKIDVPLIYAEPTAPWRHFPPNLLLNFDEFTARRSKDNQKIVISHKYLAKL